MQQLLCYYHIIRLQFTNPILKSIPWDTLCGNWSWGCFFPTSFKKMPFCPLDYHSEFDKWSEILEDEFAPFDFWKHYWCVVYQEVKYSPFFQIIQARYCEVHMCLWPNSPAPLTDDWKVTDNSSVNFYDVFFFIFCQIIAKNEDKHVMEIYGSVVP